MKIGKGRTKMEDIKTTYLFGINPIDVLLGGMLPGELILLGSEHKAGRSTLGLHLAIYNALNKIPSAYFSFIYNQGQMQKKIYNIFSAVDKNKQTSPENQKILGQNVENLNKAPLYLEITENENRTNDKFLKKLEKEIENKALKLIILDDLSMLFPLEKSPILFEEEIGILMRGLKALALKKEVLIFVTVPLNSDISINDDSNVTYARGLGFTSELETVADRVLYLYKDYASRNNQRNIFMIKNNNKKKGTAVLDFDETKGCFLAN